MQKQPIDEHLMTDYLLGALSEADTERLDKMSLTDGEFADWLLAVENDLVDSYARGELSGDLLNRFTSHYLASPRSREKVKVAATFLLFADQAATAPAIDSGAFTRASPATGKTGLQNRSRPSFFAMPRLTLQWGFAVAALLFLVAGGYLAYENLRLRHEMTQTQTERTALEQREQELQRQLTAQRLADAGTEQELAQVRERLAQLEQQQPNVQPRDQKVIAFNLSPPTRGGGQVATLTLPEQVDSVTLTLELEATGFASYRVALKNSATAQLSWRSGKLKASAKGRLLRVSVPASLLKPQNYVLELSGFSANGVVENVGSYPFRVVKS